MIKGRVRLLGDNISGDHILPGNCLGAGVASQEAVRFLFRDYIPGFAATLQPGDILVAGENFGCGSTREQVLQVLLAAGIRCVIAKSFSRAFFRGGINLGILPVRQCIAVRELDAISVDMGAGIIMAGDKSYSIPPFPPQLQGFVSEGGLIAYYKHHKSL